MRYGSWLLALLVVCPVLLAQDAPRETQRELARRTQPELLTFDELVAAAATATPAGPLKEKLARLLAEPFVSNEAALAGQQPRRPQVEGLGTVLRAAFWNIERGTEFDLIRLALSSPAEFLQRVPAGSSVSAEDRAVAEEQLRALQESDVLILNEVDLGMKRSDYRDVARELAEALGMNYVYGVEFVEVDRLHLGLEQADLDDDTQERQLREQFQVDRERYRGLHGSAILSRYPIRRARIHRLPACHDWYGQEVKEIAELEKGRRWTANTLFLERISREVRHGGRMALIAELNVPELPAQGVTVVATHLENKAQPQCRREQMDEVLRAIQEVDQPVILAGDLNTTGSDATPTSIRRELMKRVKDYRFWAGQAIQWFSPVTMPRTLLFPVNYFKNHRDPTAMDIPVLAGNREGKLFDHIRDFRFADRGAFDFRGRAGRTLTEKESTLANSNQRADKGFRATFSFRRDYGGLVGSYKLDWFFVKPFITHPAKRGQSYRFAPHFARTMQELNSLVPEGMSDHHPVSVDLPLAEPPAVAP